MASDWIPVFSTNQIYEAEMVKLKLEEHEIECILVNKQDSVYHFGEIEVFVPIDKAFLAVQLIHKTDSE